MYNTKVEMWMYVNCFTLVEVVNNITYCNMILIHIYTFNANWEIIPALRNSVFTYQITITNSRLISLF